MILQLNNTLQQISNLKVDKVYYNCFDAKDFNMDFSQEFQAFKLKQNNFLNYITKNYGLKNSMGFTMNFNLPDSIALPSVSIFSKDWIDNYGAAFRKDIQSKISLDISNQIKSYNFDSDFSCSAHGNISSFSGTIDSIKENIISVTG